MEKNECNNASCPIYGVCPDKDKKRLKRCQRNLKFAGDVIGFATSNRRMPREGSCKPRLEIIEDIGEKCFEYLGHNDYMDGEDE